MAVQEKVQQQINTPPDRPAEETQDNRIIFIVGVSRSGTTLVRFILNQSDKIAITRENHFLGHVVSSEGMRQKFRRFGDLKNDDNVRQLVRYLYSGGSERSSIFRRSSSHWRWITKHIDREVFTQKILESDRSDRAFFYTVLHIFAEKKGKSIMGEKTPAHFRYVPTLISWFPQAKIIHMLRDPRGNYVSEWRRRQREAQSFPYKQLKHFPALMKLIILLQITYTWRESARNSREYLQQYPQNYYPLRFEDLVSDPENQIKALCRFIGVEFQPKMMNQKVVSMGFQEKQSGFDAEAATRWKKYIQPWADTWLRFWLGHDMKRLGYEMEPSKDEAARQQPSDR